MLNNVDKPPNFTLEGVFDRHLLTMSAAVLWHVQWCQVVLDAGIVAPFIRAEDTAVPHVGGGSQKSSSLIGTIQAAFVGVLDTAYISEEVALFLIPLLAVGLGCLVHALACPSESKNPPSRSKSTRTLHAYCNVSWTLSTIAIATGLRIPIPPFFTLWASRVCPSPPVSPGVTSKSAGKSSQNTL